MESARMQNKAIDNDCYVVLSAINLDQLCIWMYMIYDICTIAGWSRCEICEAVSCSCLFVYLFVSWLVSFEISG